MAIKVLSAASFLTFTNQATSNIKWKHIRHRLRLGDKLETGMSLQVASNRLWFQQVATLTKILHVSVGNSLSFSSYASPRALTYTAESGFPIAHWTTCFISHPAYSLLILSQTVTCELVKYNVEDVFTLTQTVTYELKKSTNVAQSFSLRHGVSVYKEDKNYIGPHPDV